MKRLVILGATGSVGRSALAVVRRHPGRFRVVGLAAGRSVAALAALAAEFRPTCVALADPAALDDRPDLRTSGWRSGPDGVAELAAFPSADIVVNAIVGAAGLRHTIAALAAGKRCALANKESLVAAGEIVLDAARRGGGELVPVDSEHSAILQCIGEARPDEVRRIILTASGGPFRDLDAAAMMGSTPHGAQAPTLGEGPRSPSIGTLATRPWR